LPAKSAIKRFYANKYTQFIVAVLIFTYFFVQCLQAQLDPALPDTGYRKYDGTWIALEDLFNVLFFFELFINAYAHWMWPFLHSGWNIFDIVVVLLGILDLCRVEFKGGAGLLNAPLRMLRVFRVFRLFGRVESLRLIIVAIEHAMPGVMNAFNIIILVMALYATLAVNFFGRLHEDCWDTPDIPGAITWRGQCFGPEYYGTFARSMYSLFQVMTGESWSEAIVRPILYHFQYDTTHLFGATFFFVSYRLVVAGVLVNVVVAVLLDGMSTKDTKEDEEDDDVELEKAIVAARAELADLRKQVRHAKDELQSKVLIIMAEPSLAKVVSLESEEAPPSAADQESDEYTL
jgi:hypothetical protein